MVPDGVLLFKPAHEIEHVFRAVQRQADGHQGVRVQRGGSQPGEHAVSPGAVFLCGRAGADANDGVGLGLPDAEILGLLSVVGEIANQNLPVLRHPVADFQRELLPDGVLDAAIFGDVRAYHQLPVIFRQPPLGGLDPPQGGDVCVYGLHVKVWLGGVDALRQPDGADVPQ